jgi:hypothetical protein
MIDSIVALGCGCFHDELTAVVLRAALDHNDADRDASMELLASMAEKGHVSTSQLVRGLEKLVLSWEDVRLDAPEAPRYLVALFSKSVNLWDKNIFDRLPEGLMRCAVVDLPYGENRSALQSHIDALAAFKSELAERLDSDLFSSCSVESFASWLRMAGKPAFHHEVVFEACVRSFATRSACSPFWTAYLSDSCITDEKRQLVLALFSWLQGSGVEETRLLDDVDVQLGFSRLLGEVGKLGDAGRDARKPVIALLRGAVENEILPAEFLKCARRMRFGGLQGVEVLKETQRQTPAYSRRVWGTGDHRQLRMEISNAILEYFDCRSIKELARVVGELHLSADEDISFVRKLLVVGMEREESTLALDAVEELVGYFWSPESVKSAFLQLRDIATDLVLDFPHCREHTTELVSAAIRRGLLQASYLQEDGMTIV